MNKLREIIEHRSKGQREDFLEYLQERGIEKGEREDIISIIISYFPIHNDWALVLLIDLSNDERLISENLLNTYSLGLLATKTYYIKLSILDYITTTRDLYEKVKIPIDFSFVEKLAYDKRERLIVRNQALLLLLMIYPLKKEELLVQLKKNIKNTTDYKTYIRLYNSLLYDNFYKILHKDEVLYFIKISDTLDLGKAVKIKSEELKSRL